MEHGTQLTQNTKPTSEYKMYRFHFFILLVLSASPVHVCAFQLPLHLQKLRKVNKTTRTRKHKKIIYYHLQYIVVYRLIQCILYTAIIYCLVMYMLCLMHVCMCAHAHPMYSGREERRTETRRIRGWYT